MFIKISSLILSPSSEKNILYILTILECIEKLTIYSKGYNSADEFLFGEDQIAFNASCHLLLAIGEESKKIDNDLKDEFSFIEWDQIAGMRNRIADDYRGIDPEIVFRILQNESEILKGVMIKMLWISGATNCPYNNWLNHPIMHTSATFY